MKNIFSLKLWTNLRPGSIQPEIQKIFVICVFTLFVFTIVFYLLKDRKRSLINKIWQKLAFFSLINFIIGIFLLFFTYELIPFLSMRLWFLLWGIEMITWLFFILKTYLNIPKIKEKITKEEEYKKYIP